MRARSEGIGLIVAGCLPFLGGALLAHTGTGAVPPCPFRAVTGLPCPVCGGTRAFVAVARGDSAFLHFNAFWVLFAVALVIAGCVVLLSGRQILDASTSTPRRTMITFGALGFFGWTYALLERGWIAP